MAKYIDDAILNYLADQIQRLAPDEQEWVLNNLTDLVRERMTEIGEPTHSLLELEGLGAEIMKGAHEEYLYEEALYSVRRLKPEDQLKLFKDLASSILPKAKIGPQHNVMEFEGAAGDFWKEINVKQFIEEERNSWDRDI